MGCAASPEGGAPGGVAVEDVLLEPNDAQVGLADGHRAGLVALVAACITGAGWQQCEGDGGDARTRTGSLEREAGACSESLLPAQQ